MGEREWLDIGRATLKSFRDMGWRRRRKLMGSGNRGRGGKGPF